MSPCLPGHLPFLTPLVGPPFATSHLGCTRKTGGYGYDNLGRLDQVALPDGSCREYGYDLDSNRTQTREAATGCGGSFTTTASYTYDPAGTLASRTSATTTTRYLYGGTTTPIFETDTSGTITLTTVQGPAGELVPRSPVPR